MIKMLMSLFLASVFTAVFAANAAAIQEVNSLKGVTSLDVVVENIREDVPVGITADELRSRIVSALQRNGIQTNAEAAEFLYLNVNPVCDAKLDACAINISIAFEQFATVNNGEMCYAVTWQSAYAVLVPTNDAPDSIVELTLEQLNSFINDYFKANP